MKHSAAHPSLQVRHKSLGRRMLDHWQIYLLLLPAIVYFIIFYYWPMAGLQIAFRDYRVSKGIWDSTWVGLKYFQKFFNQSPFYFFAIINQVAACPDSDSNS